MMSTIHGRKTDLLSLSPSNESSIRDVSRQLKNLGRLVLAETVYNVGVAAI